MLKIAHSWGGTPWRRMAIKRAEQWILQRAGQNGTRCTDGLGAIFPPMVYLQIAFKALGYGRSHPVIQRAERELDAFFIHDTTKNEIRIQPCFSPVWDTGIALYALTDCGLTSDNRAVKRAADWLLSNEAHHIGDWADNVDLQSLRLDRHPPKLQSNDKIGAWYFEYHNAWYPDCDDTAMVAMALQRAGGSENLFAAQRAVQWLFAMQNDDGGWAAFDKTRHRQWMEYIPFADHNAMQDPSCPDITGRVLECLSWCGYDNRHPAIRRAIAYIRSHQTIVGIDDLRLTIDDWNASTAPAKHSSPVVVTGNGDARDINRQSSIVNRQYTLGCWFGRWGVNYIYGTWQAVIGPIRCGEDPNQDWIVRAGEWIKSIQKDDGSFGESANSYEDASLKGQGPSTASQTAWAAMILQEIFGKDDPDLKRAINWLASSQLTEADSRDPAKNPDGDLHGSWVETEFTGTGFPRVFYLRYHMYRLYFPLMALGRYVAAHQAEHKVRTMIEMQPMTTSSAQTV